MEHEEGCMCHLCLPGSVREEKKVEEEEYEGIETGFEPRPYFQKWAKEKGINMDDKEDWEPWWDCWCHGYNKGIQDIKEIL